MFATAVILGNWFWYAVAANMFGPSIAQIAAGFGVPVAPEAVSVLGVVSVLGGSLIAIGGPGVIKWTSRILVTVFLAIGVIVLVLCFTMAPLGGIVAYRPDPSELGGNGLEAYALAAEGMVAFSFSWSTQAMVLPRLCRTERGGYWGTVAAYGFIAPLFVFIGGVMAIVMFLVSGTLESDPTVMVALLGPQVALLSLMLVAFANIGTQAVGSYVNVLVLKAAWPKIDYREGDDCYRFKGGVNWVGVSTILATLIVALVFVYNPITGSIQSSLFCFLAGSGFTAVFAAGLYYALSRVPSIRALLLRDRDDLEIV
ncbi:hypothetical protein [Berryella intestinalis]|uniref:hypothetical protein n=1 Tax=Berryella intestinalis TaxID=1531429 RepID=UPI002A74B881|nr:hypothetical protein [Berryella intestinalis]